MYNIGVDLSVSFIQILNAGSEDIKALQHQLRDSIENDIAHAYGSGNPGMAIVYFQAGSMMGDPTSTFNLALCHHFGRGVQQDMKKVLVVQVA